MKLRNLYLSLITSLFFLNPIQGNEASEQKSETLMKLTLLGGMQGANDTLKKSGFGDGGQLSFNIGGQIDLPEAPFQIGLFYSPRQTKYKLSSNITVTRIVNYIDIPMMYRLRLGAFSLGFGGYYSFGSGKVSKITDNGSSTSEENLVFSKAAQSEIDHGGMLAIGCHFDRYLIEGRYLHGLADVATDSENSSYRVFQLLFGYRF